MDPDTWLHTIVDLTLAVELCCGAAANCLVLRVFFRKPDLLSLANRFVVNLTIVNILTCLTLLPLTIADDAASSSSTLLCSLSEFSSHFAASVIPYSILLIAIDQYFAVVNPLHYHTVINSLRSYWMIAAAWIVPLLVSGLSLLVPQTIERGKGAFRFCRLLEADAESSISAEDSSLPYLSLFFSVIFVALSFVVPFIFICFIYSRICAAASGNTRRTRTDLGFKTTCTRATTSERDDIEWDLEDTGLQMSATPALILTRASPPRVDVDQVKRSCKSAVDLCAKDEVVVVVQETIIKPNFSLPNLKTKRTDKDVTLLKPFIPRNTSFSLPSTSIPSLPPHRRHSNDVPIHRIDSDLLPKSGMLSKQSSFTSSSRSSSWRIPISRASSIRSTSSFLVNNLRHRLSNAGLFRYKERARAARVSALVIVMALICWSPFFAVYILHTGIEFSGTTFIEVPQLLDSLVIAFLLISTVSSPALFAYRNRRIRREIKRIINECKNCTSLSSSSKLMQRVKVRVLYIASKLKGESGPKVTINTSPSVLSPTTAKQFQL